MEVQRGLTEGRGASPGLSCGILFLLSGVLLVPARTEGERLLV